VLELVEAAFDAIALFVQFAIVGSRLFPISAWRDHRHRAQALDLGYDLGRVVALVGDDGFGLTAFQKLECLSIFGSLSWRDAEGDRQPVLVGQQVDLGAQTSSGTPQSRVFGAPFLRPAAACWCARTMVESSIR
jgi:hypothetical protein